MATIAQQLHNIGRSLTSAADAGDFGAVAKWAKRALALVAPVVPRLVAPVGVPDLTPLTLDEARALIAQGQSPLTDVYTQQLFALEAYPELVGPISGSWPSEALTSADRRQALIQFVSSEVGSGPAYGPTPITNGQVLAAFAWNEAAGEGLALNPVYAVALGRAAKVAALGKPDAGIPWGPADSPIQVIPTGSYGQSVVSGYYGTGEGPAPVA